MEFKNELRREANFALGWPARTAALLMLVSTVITYFDAQSRSNPNAIYTVFAYSFSISIVILYPFLTAVFSQLEKYSVQFLDLLCLSGIFGFSSTLLIVFDGVLSPESFQSIFLLLQGQVAFVLAIASAFASSAFLSALAG